MNIDAIFLLPCIIVKTSKMFSNEWTRRNQVIVPFQGAILENTSLKVYLLKSFKDILDILPWNLVFKELHL